MWQYWLIFFIPAWLALKFPHNYAKEKKWTDIWKLYFWIMVIIIGYRYQVGGDWDAYNNHIVNSENLDFELLNLNNEPLFVIFSWLGGKWGGIYLFNLFSGAIFSYGLIQLSLHFSRPWLCISIATPYLIIVVAMGYSRQAGALGAFMLGLCYLIKGDMKKYILWVVFGSLMHKSVIVALGLAIIHKKSLSLLNVFLVALILSGFYLLTEKYLVKYYQNYVINEYGSSGALIRASLNLVPAVIYLTFRKKFLMFSPIEQRIYLILSLLALFIFFSLFYTNASTALDRIGLYLLPLQFIILGNLPEVLGRANHSNRGWVLLILIGYSIVEFVWLFYAEHSRYWIPYHFYLWEQLWF